jgi:hypothetical protein
MTAIENKSSPERYPNMYKFLPELAEMACDAMDLEWGLTDQVAAEKSVFEIAISKGLVSELEAKLCTLKFSTSEMMDWIESKSAEIDVTIYAIVKSTVDVGEGERRDSVSDRFVDIYLHGPANCPDASSNASDLGGSTHVIVTKPEDELCLVNKGFLRALIDTAKRTTDLEAVYNDETGMSFDWADMKGLIIGLDD